MMKQLKTLLIAVTFVLLIAPAARAELVIYAVNGPIGYFAERLAGDQTSVIMPAPADEDPAFWQPSLDELTNIQSADLILLNGAGYAKWIKTVSLPRSRTIDTSRSFQSEFIEEEPSVTHSHGSGDAHSHAGTAFTTWLNFEHAAAQAQTVSEALISILPDARADIESKLSELLDDLDQLHVNATAVGLKLNGEAIIVSHPIYQYLASAYDLNLHSLIWEPDVIPTEAQLQELDELVKATNAKTMIWENQPDPKSVDLVNGFGLTNLVFETGNAIPPGDDFIKLMQQGIDALSSMASD